MRVAGVTGIDALSRERIRQAAQRIATATRLDVDITAGASGAPTAVDLPAGPLGRPRLALTETWVRPGVAARVLSAVDRKSLLLFALILVVCALFVTNAASAAVRARRGELGVLACLGWSTGRLFAVVLAEVALVGFAAGVLGGLLALPLAALVGVDASPARAALAVPAATGLALLAGLVPAARAARAQPIAAVRPAVLEVRRAWRPRGLGGLALVNLVRTPGRSALGALSLAIGVCALTLLLAATIAFNDVLVGTLLGDAVAVQVRGTDYVAVVTTILLGVAAVADVLFLGLRERAGELATLEAGGWDDRALGRLVAFEGLWIGAAGAVAGAAAGLAGAAAFAGALPGALVLDQPRGRRRGRAARRPRGAAPGDLAAPHADRAAAGRRVTPIPVARAARLARARDLEHDLDVAVDPGVGERDLLARARALEQQVDARAGDPQAADLDAVEPARERRAADPQPAAQTVRHEPEPARHEVRDRARRPGLRLARDRVRHRRLELRPREAGEQLGQPVGLEFEAASSSASKIRSKSSSKPYLRSPNAIIAVSCGQTVPRW